MKKTIMIMIVTAASIFVFAGCQKETASSKKPAEQSAPTSTAAPVTPSHGC